MSKHSIILIGTIVMLCGLWLSLAHAGMVTGNYNPAQTTPWWANHIAFWVMYESTVQFTVPSSCLMVVSEWLDYLDSGVRKWAQGGVVFDVTTSHKRTLRKGLYLAQMFCEGERAGQTFRIDGPGVKPEHPKIVD